MLLTARKIDPPTLVRALRSTGAAAYPLLAAPERAGLAAAARELDYAPQPERVGPPERRVYQRLASAQLGADPGAFGGLVQRLGTLVAGVHAAAANSPWTAAPTFNDCLVQRYPPGPYALTPHLDGKRFVDLVVIVVLEGAAQFCVCADRAGNACVDIPAPPGHAIFMRAPGFDGAEDGRPFHCVLNVTAERYTVGLRNNSRA